MDRQTDVVKTLVCDAFDVIGNEEGFEVLMIEGGIL